MVDKGEPWEVEVELRGQKKCQMLALLKRVRGLAVFWMGRWAYFNKFTLW